MDLPWIILTLLAIAAFAWFEARAFRNITLKYKRFFNYIRITYVSTNVPSAAMAISSTGSTKAQRGIGGGKTIISSWCSAGQPCHAAGVTSRHRNGANIASDRFERTAAAPVVAGHGSFSGSGAGTRSQLVILLPGQGPR